MPLSVEHFDNESWFKISDYDSMRPFFMSIVSDSNHWMFISSNGGLSAGRKNSEYSLFPYYTDDKITELAHTTGSKTVFQVMSNGSQEIWEPFCDKNAVRHSVSRNLYKNRYGDKIIFEEINHDLSLVFKYKWESSDAYGFVRTSTISNSSNSTCELSVLDGIQNLMPYGVSPDLQTRASNLVDAYKRSELDPTSGMGLFALSAIIVDKAEPSEALKTNVAWSYGLDKPTYLLSSLQLEAFKSGKAVHQEEDVKGEKGAYFLNASIQLEGNSTKNWTIVANVNLNHSQVAALSKSIQDNDGLANAVANDVELGTNNLVQLVASSDGLQQSEDVLKNARHFSNVLFNIMRGGIFDNNYLIEKNDFVAYLENASKKVVKDNQSFISELNEEFSKPELDAMLSSSEDKDLVRLGKEYLPLKFSRRHGDPSRPWNKFSINTHNELDGSKILDYEGNWRDIFQNWEALAYSYPDFLEGMIYKFLNATTFDGYNPYRVTKGGFDWEIIEPDDPWSYIGYWGDHQIIYLLKFLEFYQNYRSEEFTALFDKEVFVYANVPYRIKSYEDIAADPKDTIEFDEKSDSAIRKKVSAEGADGALREDAAGNIHHVNFIEKILATVLSKVSNLIPEGGIWMNTQRPEWNDANNALVGNGVSMVTLYYLHRFLTFLKPVLDNSKVETIQLSTEMATFFTSLSKVLNSNSDVVNGSVSDAQRKEITEGLGKAGSTFRDTIYDHGFSGESTAVGLNEIKEFVQVTIQYLEQSIQANKREDDLYHAYNIMEIEGDGITISYLDEMLEGQTAVLSAGYLSAEESLSVLNALRKSALYREDQQSYILYPNKNLPGFLSKNSIPKSSVMKSELLQSMISENDHRLVSKDVNGNYHFNGNFKNAGDLKEALDELSESAYALTASQESELILSIFEDVFNHKAFTGRSGTFFAFEGLGSIYWHMVSKLHLAVTEVCIKAANEGADGDVMSQLLTHFDEIGEGIGVHKTPELYGAFPTDPYSHTPYHKGAQQPGMTGQVKEDILVRFAELGIQLQNGQLVFQPSLLKASEFTTSQQSMTGFTVTGERFNIEVPSNGLAFTYCQIPVVYQLADSDQVLVQMNDGELVKSEGLTVNSEITASMLQRLDQVKQITVHINRTHLRDE